MFFTTLSDMYIFIRALVGVQRANGQRVSMWHMILSPSNFSCFVIQRLTPKMIAVRGLSCASIPRDLYLRLGHNFRLKTTQQLSLVSGSFNLTRD